MSNVGYYKSTAEVEDAMAVVAKWISDNRSIKVVYHKGTEVDADIEKGIIRIPRMACASGVTEDALMLCRGHVYHESGHIGETKGVPRSEYPKGALFSIWNAIEDRSMEARTAKKRVGAGPVFSWMLDFYNKEIAGKADKGKAALWEALVAMSFQSEGKAPMWKLSDKAQVYFDKGYDKFSEWRGCDGAPATLELAKELHEILKDASEEFNKQKEEQKQGGGQGEGQEGEGEEGQEKQGKGKSKKSEKGEEKSEKGDGQGEEGDEEGEEGEGKSGKGEGKDEEGDEDGEGSGSGSGDFEDEGEEKDGEGDAGGEGEGTEEGADGSDGDGSAEGESDGAEGGSEGGKADSKAGKSDEGKSEKAGEGKGEVTPGGEYNPQDEEAKGGKGNKGADWGKDLEDECDGMSQQQAISKALEEMFGEMDTRDMYFSRRDLDEHKVVPSTDEDKTSFKDLREAAGVAVATMTGALKQALRAMSRVRKNPYQRQGRIDNKRLVAISQGLSKEVFFRKTEGVDLDVAVEIVIDESGSMSGACGEVAKLAVVLGENLKAIGVPFEVTGSTTAYGQGDHRMPEMGDMHRVNPIVYKHYKTFGEDWAAVRQRVVNVSALQHNVDGEVVEYAAFRLAGRKERRKIVFSLSDGEPCAGHFNDREMGRNLKKVCERARKNGVEVYGFGIGTYGPEPLYGKQNFMFLEKADTMGADFIKDFVGKITGGRVRV